eukprot:4259768-Karenia_brevis.AAC.1
MAFVAWAERRARIAAEEVVTPEAALQAARAQQAELDAEFAAGRARLESLRTSAQEYMQGAAQLATPNQPAFLFAFKSPANIFFVPSKLCRSAAQLLAGFLGR